MLSLFLFCLGAEVEGDDRCVDGHDLLRDVVPCCDPDEKAGEGDGDDGGDDIYSFRSWIAHYVARFVFEEQDTCESFYRDKWESRGDYESDSKVCFMLDANCCPEGLVFVDDARKDGLVFLTDTIMDTVAKLIPKEIL